MSNINNPEAMKPAATRVDTTLDEGAKPVPPETAGVRPLVMRYEGSLTAQETGDYALGLKASGFFRIQVDGKNVTSAYDADPSAPKLGQVHLEAGKPAKLQEEYTAPEKGYPNAVLVWNKVDWTPRPEAVAAAKNADVGVAVLGITSELEGEEMQVSVPGFKGGDRTSIDLPQAEEDLLKAVAAAGKPVVLVLTYCCALSVIWAIELAIAILDAFYPGEVGGTAVAETHSGKNNPAGRLAVTFYK